MGRVGCPETSITCYRYTLCNIPEERRCQLHRGGCLKSRIRCIIWLARKLYNPLRVVTLKIQCITTAVGTTNFIFTIKRRMFRPIKVIMRFFFLPWRFTPGGPRPRRYRGFTITLRRTTLGGNPPDEWSARHWGLYLTTHSTHKRQTSMSPVRFEPTIPAREWPQTHALDSGATGISHPEVINRKSFSAM